MAFYLESNREHRITNIDIATKNQLAKGKRHNHFPYCLVDKPEQKNVNGLVWSHKNCDNNISAKPIVDDALS